MKIGALFAWLSRGREASVIIVAWSLIAKRGGRQSSQTLPGRRLDERLKCEAEGAKTREAGGEKKERRDEDYKKKERASAAKKGATKAAKGLLEKGRRRRRGKAHANQSSSRALLRPQEHTCFSYSH